MAVQTSLFDSKASPAVSKARSKRRVRVDQRLSESVDRLVDRILEGRVVPFLGAGVSLKSQARDGTSIAATSVMICSVCRTMRAHLAPPCHCGCCNGKHSCSKRRGLAQTCEEYLWTRSRRSLVLDVLRIRDFECLQPSEAHRYIAYLAREGLVPEVITTNYDTSLEQAYRESIRDARQEGATESISSLAEYRRQGATVEGSRGIPFLKIYHVNGCADDLHDNTSATACESIVLTERQLQDWGRRQWAKDLLRDRLRSRSILFSGFGSPEPQVRHTVLQIVEEFDSGSWEDSDISSVYIHAYRDLTFEQKQILVSYSQARRKRASRLWERNCFTRDHASAFGVTSCDALPADAFWKSLFKKVFWRLLSEQWLSIGTPYYYFLSRYAACAEILMRNVRDWLLLPGTSVSTYFSESLDMEDGSMPFAAMLWRIHFRRTVMQCGWYAPLKERGLLISAFFTFCYLLEQIDPRFEDLHDHGPLGYGVRVTDSMLLCISSEDSLFRSGEEVLSGDRKCSVVVQIVFDGATALEQKRIKLVDETGGEKWRMVTVYQIPFGDFIAGREGISASYDDVVDAARMAIESPRIVMDRARRRRRYRVRPL